MKRYTTQNPTKYFIFITISSGVLPQHHQSLSKCVMLQWANDSRHCPLWWRPFLASRKGQTRVLWAKIRQIGHSLGKNEVLTYQHKMKNGKKSTNAFILQRLKILLVFHQSSRIFFFSNSSLFIMPHFQPILFQSNTSMYKYVILLKAYSTYKQKNHTYYLSK